MLASLGMRYASVSPHSWVWESQTDSGGSWVSPSGELLKALRALVTCFQPVQEAAASAKGLVKSHLQPNGSVKAGPLVRCRHFVHLSAPTFGVSLRLSSATLKHRPGIWCKAGLWGISLCRAGNVEWGPAWETWLEVYFCWRWKRQLGFPAPQYYPSSMFQPSLTYCSVGSALSTLQGYRYS